MSDDSDTDEPSPEALKRYLSMRRHTVGPMTDPRCFGMIRRYASVPTQTRLFFSVQDRDTGRFAGPFRKHREAATAASRQRVRGARRATYVCLT